MRGALGQLINRTIISFHTIVSSIRIDKEMNQIKH
jgi:hypothetical protein